MNSKFEGKLNVKKSNEEESDNGWEMITEINENFFKNLFISNAGRYWTIDKIVRNIYKLYKEKNNIELYLKYYCNYLGVNLYPETNYPSEVLLKFFIYAYTLDERNKDKSFYSMLNDTLRSGDYEKIKKFMEIFVKLRKLIQSNAIMSYKGNVYRASYFKDNLLKEIKVGKQLINAALWSCTKDEIIAKKFKKKCNKNVIIYTNLDGPCNVDIHEEKISQFLNEKEVLVLPFCTFEVKSLVKVNDSVYGDYYKLELELLNRKSNIEYAKEINFQFYDLK